MNASVTTGVRELSAQELDQVTGGLGVATGMSDGEFWFAVGIGASFIASGITALFDWLFG
jgi:hypothetical protein